MKKDLLPFSRHEAISIRLICFMTAFCLLLTPFLAMAQYIGGDPDSLPTVSPSNTVTMSITKYEKSCHDLTIITKDTLLQGKAFFIIGNMTHSDFAIAVPSGDEVRIFPVMNDTMEKSGVIFCDTIDFTGDSVKDLMITWCEYSTYGGTYELYEGNVMRTKVEIWDATHANNILAFTKSVSVHNKNYEYGRISEYCDPDFVMTFENSILLIVDRNFPNGHSSFKGDGWKKFSYSNGKFRKIKN
ncbi:MAG TPA: hypothetical protein VL651_10045 [Bacteroidia bacterium]|jgi:hypothetical protein|nr:hypothetical protein [Bacteroidia bacterium]